MKIKSILISALIIIGLLVVGYFLISGIKSEFKEPESEKGFGGSSQAISYRRDLIGTEASPYSMANGTTTGFIQLGRDVDYGDLMVYTNASGTESIFYQLAFSNDDSGISGCASSTDTTITWFGESSSNVSSGVDTISATTTRKWASPGAGVHNFRDPLTRGGSRLAAQCMRMTIWNSNSGSSTDVWVEITTKIDN